MLATDIHQRELELLCDMLIGYAYSLNGVNEKAKIIYEDVLSTAERSAMFNIIIIAKFFLTKLLISESKKEEALLLINDALAAIRKHNDQAKILFALFEQQYIDIVKDGTLVPCDIESEEMKLVPLKEALKKILS